MDSKERIEKAYSNEISFLDFMKTECLCLLQRQTGFKVMFRAICGKDISRCSSNKEIIEMIENFMPSLLIKQSEYKQFLENFRKSNISKNLSIEVCDLDGSLKDLSTEDILINVHGNLRVIDIFIDIYNYAIEVAKLKESVRLDEDPVKLFKKIEFINRTIVEKAKRLHISDEETLYDSANMVIDEFLNDEYYQILSLPQLKKELKEESMQRANDNLHINNGGSGFKKKLYELLNIENDEVDIDLGNLKKIGLVDEQIALVVDKKDKFDKQFSVPFVAIDDEMILELAQDRILELKNDIDFIKRQIFDAFSYVSLDIKDILREKHAFQIGKYIEKLRELSEKFDKMIGELDYTDSAELFNAYNKVLTIYNVISEMKQNSYVIDVSRFSK